MIWNIAAGYYIGARGTWADEGGFLNHYTSGSDINGSWSALNFYNTGSYGADSATPSNIDPYLQAAVRRHAWLDLHFHGINNATTFGQLLDYILTKDVWIAPFGAIVRYMKERLFSTLTVVSETSSEIRLTLTHTLDPSIFNFPLTIRSTIPSSWTQVQITQGSTTVTVTPVVEGSETVVYYSATPNGGEITLIGGGAGNPVPVLTNMTPTSALAGSGGFTLTVYGSNFVPGAAVRWNGANRTTSFVSSTQLAAAIPASDIAVAGTAQVTVFNPAPGGGTSNAQTFTINNPNNPVPTTTSLSPSSATAGGPAFTLTVNGSGFVANSVVRWSGASRTTTYVSATQMIASISTADIAAAGTAQVTVFNPAPGGGTSQGLIFTVNLRPTRVELVDPPTITTNGTRRYVTLRARLIDELTNTVIYKDSSPYIYLYFYLDSRSIGRSRVYGSTGGQNTGYAVITYRVSTGQHAAFAVFNGNSTYARSQSPTIAFTVQ